MAQGFIRGYPTTGVWWDLNSCPVPADFDPALVLPSIESAVRRFLGRRPVTVFAVGNLDDVSPGLLEKISSSGILLRHTPCGGLEVCDLLKQEWEKPHPPPAPIMLISSDTAWFLPSFTYLGYSVLRAYDGPPPQFPHSPSLKVWGWQSLLKEYSDSSYVKMTNCQVLEDFPACFCFMCEIPSQSFDDFIKHLKSKEHIQEFFDTVPSYDAENDRPKHFCQLCKYPAYDSYMMDIHYKSEVHAQKELVTILAS